MTAYSSFSSLKFDEASASLGDELRAARAAGGRSLADVEADLRIKAKYIEAIEATDLTALPQKVYADGFVRSYAQYLGLDPSEVLQRFNEESGYLTVAKAGAKKGQPVRSAEPDGLAVLEKKTRGSGTLGGLMRGVMALWPLALLAGFGAALWYGVQAARDAGMLPEDLAIFGEAPSDQPIIEANLSDNSLDPEGRAVAVERPENLSYAELGAPPFWSAPEEDAAPLDGPMASIDVEEAGMFSAEPVDAIGAPETEVAAISPEVQTQIDAVSIAAATRAALGGDVETPQTEAADAVPQVAGFALIAHADTWIEVRSSSGNVAFSGILGDGDSYDIPETGSHRVKIGNAGGLFLALDGREVGPFGGNGVVMRRVSLDADDLRARFPVASENLTASE